MTPEAAAVSARVELFFAFASNATRTVTVQLLPGAKAGMACRSGLTTTPFAPRTRSEPPPVPVAPVFFTLTRISVDSPDFSDTGFSFAIERTGGAATGAGAGGAA